MKNESTIPTVAPPPPHEERARSRPAPPAAHGDAAGAPFDERTIELFLEGLVKGSTHSAVGQEAVVAGASLAFRDDNIVSHDRDHGHCIAKGAAPRLMMAELMRRETGRGLGGSMHITALDRGILGANGIVGLASARERVVEEAAPLRPDVPRRIRRQRGE